MNTVRLANGVRMPGIGMGVFQIPDGETTRQAVADALQVGYRHIDTAAAYGNEVSVGEGIRAAGIPREQLFVATKHWVTERGYEKTVRAVEDSLKRLGLEYLDLYMIHWPMVEKTSPEWKAVNASTWKGFERMYRDGKIRAIGVSNFLPHHLEALLENCAIAPAVNQLEFHPGYPQLETVRWCQTHAIQVTAWSPLGSGRLIENETIRAIAGKYGKSSAQICLRFALQNQVVPLVKSIHKERLADNLRVFDFEIAEADMRILREMPQAGYSGWYPDDAPAETYNQSKS